MFRSGFFRLRRDECQLPDGRVQPRYFVFEFAAWIQIVALDTDGKMIMVRQYRHAAGQEFLEIPGGSHDPHTGETELMAAKRELREETGYISDDWAEIGTYFPNPALQSNRIVVFLAQDCRYEDEPQLDPFEDLDVEKHSVEDIYRLLESGQLQHGLIMGSLALARPHLLAKP